MLKQQHGDITQGGSGRTRGSSSRFPIMLIPALDPVLIPIFGCGVAPPHDCEGLRRIITPVFIGAKRGAGGEERSKMAPA